MDTRLYAVDTFLCKHDLLVEEIGEHQEMLDSVIEMVQDLRTNATAQDLPQIETLSAEIQILMDEWNDFVGVVNNRMAVGGKLHSLLLTMEQIRDIPESELPLKSDGLPELRKGLEGLAAACGQVNLSLSWSPSNFYAARRIAK